MRYTAGLGPLSERMNIIPAIWVDGADLDLIAESGAVIAHNLVSNLRLGSGVMPFRAIRNRGIPVCLGVDRAIADDSVKLWSVMKLAAMIHNLSGAAYTRWPQAREVLACATTGGGRAMPRGTGRIAVGALAGLVIVDLDALAFTPLNDLPRHLVMCETGQSVRRTMVAGRIVMHDGRVTTVDEAALLAEARALFAARGPMLDSAARAMEDRLPHYRRMYDRAMATDVGMERRLEALS